MDNKVILTLSGFIFLHYNLAHVLLRSYLFPLTLLPYVFYRYRVLTKHH